MTFHIPPWAPAAPLALPATGGEEGRVVAVVAGQGAVAAGWAADVTAELARGWAASGARVVLADGGLTHPQLHEALSLPFGEGLSDSLLWGASMKRVAVRPEGEPFFAVTAGTAVADAEAVFRGDRWRALCAGFREAGVTLAVLVPAHDPCAAAVLGQATDAVVVATEGEDIPGIVAEAGVPVHAVMGRASAVDPEEASVDDGGSPAVLVEGADEAPAAEGDPAVSQGDGGEPEVAEPWGLEELAPDVVAPAAADPVVDDLDAGDLDAGDPDAWGADFERLDDPADVAAGDTLEVPFEDEGADGEEQADGVAFGDPLAFLGEAADEQADSEARFPAVAEDDASTDPLVDGDGWGDPLDGGHSADPLMEGPASGSEGLDDDFSFPPDADDGSADARPVPTFEEIVEDAEASYVAPEEPRAGGRARTLLLVLLLIVLGVVGAAWFGYLNIPGITPQATGAAEATPPPAQAPTVAAGPANEVAEPVAYSVALGAFQDQNTATGMAQDLSAKVPGVLFVTAPVEIQGTVMHRVLAGPASDSAAAVALADHVAQAAGLDPAGWVARWTPRAFQLGEMPDLDAARRRAGVLEGMGVPAYVLAVPYSDGSSRFRVYAGAYADESEASYLSGLLEERGLSSASFSERTGHLPE